jgi:hypothetical protein
MARRVIRVTVSLNGGIALVAGHGYGKGTAFWLAHKYHPVDPSGSYLFSQIV